MKLTFPNAGAEWNSNIVSFTEEPGGMGDRVVVSITDEHGEAICTAKVWAADLVRAGKMLAQPHTEGNER